MFRNLEIENFKSIYKEKIDIGRINVFIGENGCGKTNILEAVAMASAAKAGKLGVDELVARGIRVTKPNITFNSFLGIKMNATIEIRIDVAGVFPLYTILETKKPDNIRSQWYDKGLNKTVESNDQSVEESENKDFINLMKNLSEEFRNSVELRLKKMLKDDITELPQKLDLDMISENIKYKILSNQHGLTSYQIYTLVTDILRGINPVSREIPGINGENLDLLISTFSKEQLEELEEYASLVAWFDGFFLDKEDKLRFEGHKLDMSRSTLYFRDKFMQRKNNVFSAENANEGILHILFYLALFISKDTPKFFAIDNIETALNPRLCSKLMEVLAELAEKHDKQVLITTHNPAILDGLNLHDDEQRLFTVSRNKKGHTKVERIQLKPDQEVNGNRLKLSELWMRGYLGAIPNI